MSAVTSCALLSCRPAARATLISSYGKKHVGSVGFGSKPTPTTVCCVFPNNTKGEHGQKSDLPPFNISPVALVLHPVALQEERWQVEEKGEIVEMIFQVPGLSKEDLAVELDEDVLVIKKKAKGGPESEQRATGNYETGTGRDKAAKGAGGGTASQKDSENSVANDDAGVYARLLVPAGYSRETVTAKLASGVLIVSITKIKEYARRKINVDINVK